MTTNNVKLNDVHKAVYDSIIETLALLWQEYLSNLADGEKARPKSKRIPSDFADEVNTHVVTPDGRVFVWFIYNSTVCVVDVTASADPIKGAVPVDAAALNRRLSEEGYVFTRCPWRD